MQRLRALCALGITFLIGSSIASASPLLQDWAFGVGVNGLFGDSTFVGATDPNSGNPWTMPEAIASLSGTVGVSGDTLSAVTPYGNFDTTGATPPPGIGDIVVSVTNTSGAAQTVSVNGYFKYTFSDNNDGYYGDYATTQGTPQSFESYWLLSYDDVVNADDPVTYLNGTADPNAGPSGTNNVPTADPYQPNGGTPCCDVLLGLGESATLAPGQTWNFAFLTAYSDVNGGFVPDPSTYFYLEQKGPLDGNGIPVAPGTQGEETIYLYAPEPSAPGLMLTGLLLILAASLGNRVRRNRTLTR